MYLYEHTCTFVNCIPVRLNHLCEWHVPQPSSTGSGSSDFTRFLSYQSHEAAIILWLMLITKPTMTSSVLLELIYVSKHGMLYIALQGRNS